MPRSVVHHFVDMRQTKVVLQTGFIQIPEIHTHLNPTVLLWHRNYVGQPSWVFRYQQEPYVNLLGDLFFDLEGLVWVDPSEFLLERAGLWVKREPVIYNLRIDSRHGFVRPRENIFEIF